MKLVALVKYLDHVSYRYRLRPFEAGLRKRGWDLTVVSLSKNWRRRLPQFYALRSANAVLLQRRLLGRGELHLLRRSAQRLIYDFDDAVLFRSSNSGKGPHSRRRRSRFRATMRAADTIIAGNSFLAGLACRYTDPAKVHRIPTCVDTEAYEPAHHQSRRVATQLVWIGSASTAAALNGVRSHLEAIARALPEAQLKLICDVFPDNLPLTVVRCPWSLEREAAELATADIGISWMPDDLWSQGKCGLKILQYMVAGLPVVANPVGVHREMISHGLNGFLAETPQEWAGAICRLAHNPDLRRVMGTEGRQIASQRYGLQTWTDEFVRIVSGITG